MRSPSKGTDGSRKGVRRQRLNASDRRASILQAASRVFERNGDIGSTTTKMIAEEAGINEAVLYRHFDSKEEIFYASVIEPLHLPIDVFIRRAQPPAQRMTREERLQFMQAVMNGMVDQLAEKMPALGLVLFGSPGVAESFYRSAWEPALRDLAEGWRKIFDDVGLTDYNDPYISAQVVVGACLMLAIERSRGHLDADVQRERCAVFARMMYDGAFAHGD
jgi:AcrR family transcriptional regulator